MTQVSYKLVLSEYIRDYSRNLVLGGNGYKSHSKEEDSGASESDE